MSDFSKFHFEVETLKKTLHKNAYLTKFVDKYIAEFVNNTFVKKPVFIIVPKLELRIVLPYFGNISIIIKKRLNRCISKRLKFCKFKIIFQTGNKLKNYFRFKDHLKPYNLTLSMNLSAEAAQLPIMVKPIVCVS